MEEWVSTAECPVGLSGILRFAVTRQLSAWITEAGAGAVAGPMREGTCWHLAQILSREPAAGLEGATRDAVAEAVFNDGWPSSMSAPSSAGTGCNTVWPQHPFADPSNVDAVGGWPAPSPALEEPPGQFAALPVDRDDLRSCGVAGSPAATRETVNACVGFGCIAGGAARSRTFPAVLRCRRCTRSLEPRHWGITLTIQWVDSMHNR